ncbi:N-terminal methylation site-containing protein [Caminicella sporogenes DSM 14501]|uniref:N-terminal methylation site-containing protein n=1 Tax=Caminicella sporogenes DSM 14501 TaxID=1121266 RepID=A0A1M6LNZ3_9FIRM|nr:prepilin-type N-terminal cleavage/methylation domain-containing protein [Caminicella sporogenes]RKD27899.1 hypothetical protein BET04_02225 [Caminicella sporogenes]SHJ72908.1 N-terminal methylation site-containing protein [Caminicella sporogenes DSM 14501]
MLQKIRKQLKNKKGFTLVELIVVIAVLGILATLAIPRFTGVLNRSRQGVDEANAAMIARQIQTAWVAGDLEEGNDKDFVDNTEQELKSGSGIGKKLVNKDYLEKVPEIQSGSSGTWKVTVDVDGDDIAKITIKAVVNGEEKTLYDQ